MKYVPALADLARADSLSLSLIFSTYHAVYRSVIDDDTNYLTMSIDADLFILSMYSFCRPNGSTTYFNLGRAVV